MMVHFLGGTYELFRHYYGRRRLRGPTPAFAGYAERLGDPRLLQRCLSDHPATHLAASP
jgi:hypothetical protein